jgi:hypothetical protein
MTVLGRINTGEPLSSSTSQPNITIVLSGGYFGIKTPCISLVPAFLCGYYRLEIVVLLCSDTDVIFGRKWNHQTPNNAEEQSQVKINYIEVMKNSISVH